MLQRASATRTAAELQAGIEGQREHCEQIALDIRGLANKMGTEYELELERAVSAAETPFGECPWRRCLATGRTTSRYGIEGASGSGLIQL